MRDDAWLSFRGSIGLRAFWVRVLVCMGVLTTLVMLWALADRRSDVAALAVIGWFAAFLTQWLFFATVAKRCRAIGKPAWIAAFAAFPPLGWIWLLAVLGFRPSVVAPARARRDAGRGSTDLASQPRDIGGCPWCHARVLLRADGTCPACRRRVAAGTGEPRARESIGDPG